MCFTSYLCISLVAYVSRATKSTNLKNWNSWNLVLSDTCVTDRAGGHCHWLSPLGKWKLRINQEDQKSGLAAFWILLLAAGGVNVKVTQESHEVLGCLAARHSQICCVAFPGSTSPSRRRAFRFPKSHLQPPLKTVPAYVLPASWQGRYTEQSLPWVPGGLVRHFAASFHGSSTAGCCVGHLVALAPFSVPACLRMRYVIN